MSILEARRKIWARWQECYPGYNIALNDNGDDQLLRLALAYMKDEIDLDTAAKRLDNLYWTAWHTWRQRSRNVGRRPQR